jgi:hypothetical protein
MKKVVELEPKRVRGPNATFLYVLSAIIVVAFILLLVVGFENILGLLRYRVTIFLALGPLFGLFLWCAYKALGSKDKGSRN